MAAHPLLHQEDLAPPSARRQEHVGDAHARLGGQEGHERFVLGLAFARHERQLVLEPAEGDEAPQVDEEVGAALFGAEHLDEELLADDGRADEPCVAAAAHAGGLEVQDLDAGGHEGVVHLGA